MIICCGEALIDMIPSVDAAGKDAFTPHAGGAVFNTAVALGRLGASVGFVSGISTDLFGDMLRAQYLARQQLDRRQFHDRLTAVVHAPPDIFPEMALANAIARKKARQFLAKEEEWF